MKNRIMILVVLGTFLFMNNVYALRPPMRSTIEAKSGKDDYADTGTFTKDSRNTIFGLQTKKIGFVRRKTALLAPDLDAGLLNKPGARYYLWDGEGQLRYYIAKDVKRIMINKDNREISGYIDAKGEEKLGDPDLEISKNNEEYKLVEKFLQENNVDFPCYIVAYIPGAYSVSNSPGMPDSPVLTENDISFIINGGEAHMTRLANIPVLPLGLIRKYPEQAIAKMQYERTAFQAKAEFKGLDGDEQHRTGLRAELSSLNESIADIIFKNLDLVLVKLAENPSLSLLQEHKFFKKSVIADLLINLAEKMPDIKESIKSIALRYLESEDMSIPEQLAMELVLNKVGDEQDKIDSVRKILDTATYRDNVKIALRLFPRFDIPDSIKDEVSTRIVELLFKKEYFVYYEYCPAILEKTGLSEQVLNTCILDRDSSYLNHIMTEEPNIHMLPTLKLLAKFADKDKSRRMIGRIISYHYVYSYNPYAYVIFLGNMDYDEEVKRELDRLEVSNPNNFLLSSMIKAYTSFQFLSTGEGKTIAASRRREYNELWNYRLNDMLDAIEKDPKSGDVEYYLYMCSEIIARVKGSQLEESVIKRFIDKLLDIAEDSKQTQKYGSFSDTYSFAAKATGNLELYTTEGNKQEMFMVLTRLLNNTYTIPTRITFETIADIQINDKAIDSLLVSKVEQKVEHLFILTQILSKRYEDLFLGKLVNTLYKVKLQELVSAKNEVEGALRLSSYGIEGDDYSDTGSKKIRTENDGMAKIEASL